MSIHTPRCGNPHGSSNFHLINPSASLIEQKILQMNNKNKHNSENC